MTALNTLRGKLVPSFVAAALVIGAAEVQAQSIIRGKVVEDGTERPIVTVDFRLLGETGVTVSRTLSDADGNFRMEVADTGTFSISIRRVGYAPVVADSIKVGPEDDIELTVRLAPRAVALNAVTVVAQRSAIPQRIVEFRERAEMNARTGLGRVYDREELDRLRPSSPQQILDGIVWAGRCQPYVLLDGLPTSERITNMSYEEVEGIEIYRGVNQIPPQYYRYGMCGLAMVWTRADPPGARPFSWWRAAAAAGLLGVLAALMR